MEEGVAFWNLFLWVNSSEVIWPEFFTPWTKVSFLIKTHNIQLTSSSKIGFQVAGTTNSKEVI